MKKIITNPFLFGSLMYLLSVFSGCSINAVNATGKLPTDLVGLKLQMSKDKAKKLLGEIGEFAGETKKNEQLWRLKNDSSFSQIAVGFDKEDKIRYVTAFVEADKAGKKIRFSDVGDLKNAQPEIVPPHYRYLWEVPETDENPAYFVSIYGNNPDFVTMYSIGMKEQSNEEEESEKD